MLESLCLISLDKENNQSISYQKYEALFSAVCQKKIEFQKYMNTRTFFVSLSGRLNDYDNIVLAVHKSEYLTVKDLLFRALKVKADIDSKVLTKVMDSNSSDLLGHSNMPKDSQVLLTSTGRNSGFIYSLGGKSLIFIPLDDECCDDIDRELKKIYIPEKLNEEIPLSPSPIPQETQAEKENVQNYVNEPSQNLQRNTENTQADTKNQDILNPAPQSADAKDNKKSTDSDSTQSQDKRVKEKHRGFNKRTKEPVFLTEPCEAVRKLKKKNISVAVSSSRYSDFIFSVLNGSSDTIYPYPALRDNSDAPSKEKLANDAMQAKISCGSTLGVSISNVFYSKENDGRLFIFICIAHESHAHILKFYSRQGEDAKSFLRYCVLSFFTVLESFADTGKFCAPKKRLYEKKHKSFFWKLKSSIHFRSAMFLVPLILAVVGITAAFFGNLYSSAKAAQTYTSSVPADEYIQADNPFDSTADQRPPMNPDDFSVLGEISDISQSEEESESEQETSLDADDEFTDESSEESEDTYTETIKKEPVKKPTTTRQNILTTSVLPTKPLTTVPLPIIQQGTFTFTVRGYGHGVGMSQYGAREMAKKGYNYTNILKHYYNANGITISRDTNIPSYVIHDGKKYPIKDYLGKVTYGEINTSFPQEAIKAQIVAIYTFSKRNNFKTLTGGVAFNKNFDYRGTAIEPALNSVFGQYVRYQNTVAFTPYFSTSAGRTTSCSNVWGYGDYDYLMGKRISPENPDQRVFKISSDDFKKKVARYNSNVSQQDRIALGPDPSKWIEIISHDCAISDNFGYVAKVRVGNQIMTGNNFRCYIIGSSVLRSHCFTFTYNPLY